jgi:hypothetical protein
MSNREEIERRLMFFIGEKIDADDICEILAMCDEDIDEAKKAGYDEGYSEAESDIKDEGPDTSWFSDLETGLHLIDTDREAAKVYLERVTKFANRHLIEVAKL